MNLLKEFSLNDKCSYLKKKQHTLHYILIDKCSKEECLKLIQRGYRRFGKMFFRPICQECNECQSIKIDVDNFTFSSSQKRVLKKAANFEIIISTPNLTQEHLNLFEKYHLFMKNKKDWEYNDITAQNYYSSFVNGHNDFGYEILYFDKDRLIGVDLVDMLEDGISSIYFYYDPDYAKYSLGRYSLYNQIKIAKQNNKKWIYLGYYVKDCPSLSYKSHYKPYLTLKGRPKADEKDMWI